MTGKGKDKDRQLTKDLCGQVEIFNGLRRRRREIRRDVMIDHNDDKIGHSKQSNQTCIF